MLAVLVAMLVRTASPCPAEEPFVLDFAWLREGSVPVRQFTDKKGKQAEAAFTLHWAPEPGGGTSLIEYRDVRLVEYDGRSADDPALQSIMAPLKVFTAAVPRLRVGPEGDLLEIVGYEETVAALVGMFPEGSELAGVARQLQDTMLRPEVVEMMRTTMAERWGAWGAQWDGLEVVRGEGFSLELDPEETGGVVHRLDVEVGDKAVHRGLACVEMSTRGVADPDRVKRQLARMMGLLSPGGELSAEFPFAEVGVEQTSEAVFAEADLRPIEVRTRKVMKFVQAEGADPIVQLEEYRYEFEWPDLEPRSKR